MKLFHLLILICAACVLAGAYFLICRHTGLTGVREVISFIAGKLAEAARPLIGRITGG